MYISNAGFSKFRKGSIKNSGDFFRDERDNRIDPFCRVNVCMYVDYEDNGAARRITTPGNYS